MAIEDQLASSEYWLLHVFTPLFVTIAAGVFLKWAPQISWSWVESALAVNAAALPLCVVSGYSAFVGHWLFDLVFAVGIASIYIAAAKAPVVSVRVFAFMSPNLIAVGLYVFALRSELPNAGLGVLSIYPLIFTVLSPVMFVWLAALVRKGAASPV